MWPSEGAEERGEWAMTYQRPLRALVSSPAKQGHRSASLPGWHEAKSAPTKHSAGQGE